MYHDEKANCYDFKKSTAKKGEIGKRQGTTQLARQFQEDLILDGKQPRTVKTYLAAVSHLARHYNTPPDRLSEEQVRQYLLKRRAELATNSMRPILAGIQRFYHLTAPRDWRTLRLMRIPKHRTLPRVLVPERAWELIDATRALHLKTIFRACFTCGLRTGDVQALTVNDVDKDSMRLHVRTTKGLDERLVPMPMATYQALRDYWVTHRNPKWLFPSRESLNDIATTKRHVSERTIQRGFKDVVRSLGWNETGLVPHTLRHSYATEMAEQGVNLKVLQMYLGHKNLQATEIYLHLTRNGDEKARRIVNEFFNGPVEPERKSDDDHNDDNDHDVDQGEPDGDQNKPDEGPSKSS